MVEEGGKLFAGGKGRGPWAKRGSITEERVSKERLCSGEKNAGRGGGEPSGYSIKTLSRDYKTESSPRRIIKGGGDGPSVAIPLKKDAKNIRQLTKYCIRWNVPPKHPTPETSGKVRKDFEAIQDGSSGGTMSSII